MPHKTGGKTTNDRMVMVHGGVCIKTTNECLVMVNGGVCIKTTNL